MDIIIRSYLAASHQLEEDPNAWDVIAILDSGLRPGELLEQNSRRHLCLRFDDIVEDIPGKKMVSMDDLFAATEFARESDRLMVACRAGQSRSAALAFVLAHVHKEPTDAISLLDPKRHIPNTAVVHLGACLPDADGILNTYEAWNRSKGSVRLIDHIDAIEAEVMALEELGVVNRITMP